MNYAHAANFGNTILSFKFVEIKIIVMKKFVVLSLLLVVLVCSFSSCQKCYTCDFGNGVVQERCSKDYPGGPEALKLTIDAFEKQGYKCTQK